MTQSVRCQHILYIKEQSIRIKRLIPPDTVQGASWRCDSIIGIPGRTKPVSLMRHNSFTPLMKGRMPGHGATCMSTPIGGSCCLSPRAASSYARKRETSSGRGTAPHGSRRASSMNGTCLKPHGTARFSSMLPCLRVRPVSGSATVWKCPRYCGSFFLRWTTSSRTSRRKKGNGSHWCLWIASKPARKLAALCSCLPSTVWWSCARQPCSLSR